MKTELLKAFKEIDPEKLTEEDKAELLRFFMATESNSIRNQIAFIFSDAHFERAVPFILKKINQKSLMGYNGSLVYALQEFDLRRYFIQIIKIICDHEYEARLMAYEIAIKWMPLISNKINRKAIDILEGTRIRLEVSPADKGENSSLHFVEKTIALLQSSPTAADRRLSKKGNVLFSKGQ